MYNIKILKTTDAMRKIWDIAEYVANSTIEIINGCEKEPGENWKIYALITEQLNTYEIGRIYWTYKGSREVYRVYIEERSKKIKKWEEFAKFLNFGNIIICEKEEKGEL